MVLVEFSGTFIFNNEIDTNFSGFFPWAKKLGVLPYEKSCTNGL